MLVFSQVNDLIQIGLCHTVSQGGLLTSYFEIVVKIEKYALCTFIPAKWVPKKMMPSGYPNWVLKSVVETLFCLTSNLNAKT